MCGLSEWAVHKNVNGRQMNCTVDRELCLLPSGVTAIRQAVGQTYYIILLIFWSGWGRWAGSRETWTSFWVTVRLNGWVYVARAMALSYCLQSASTSNEDLGETGQQFVVNNIVRVYGSELGFTIHNDPSTRSRSTIRDQKIVTSLQVWTVIHISWAWC